MFTTFRTWIDPYTDWLAQTVAAHSALAPLLLLFLEEAGLPLFIPGDAVLAFTGYRISHNSPTPLWLAVCVAMMAVLAGATILFYLARRWGNIIILKIGKFIFLKPKDIKRAEDMFKKYGVWAVIFGRHIPGMRIPITIFAGSSGMRYRTFLLSTIASTLAWVMLALTIGQRFGRNIQQTIQHHVGLTVGLIVTVIVAIVALHFLGRYHQDHPED